jgi:hypothetical protein
VSDKRNEELIRDYEAWLGAALLALGVETVFDIPNWRENLDAAVKLNEEERRSAQEAMARA